MIEFKERPLRGLVGQASDSSRSNDVSRNSNEIISFGALVVFDEADPGLCKPPSKKEDLDKPLGIAMRQSAGQNYPAQCPIQIRRQGRVFVKRVPARLM